MNIYNTLLP